MLRARGNYLLMVDADGATKASDLGRLMTEVKRIERNDLGIAIGSRAHLQESSKANVSLCSAHTPREVMSHMCLQRTFFRTVLMHGFHALVEFLCGGHGINDTQCGFKLFTREAAKRLFPVQHIERWAFDVELLYLASHKNIPMTVCTLGLCQAALPHTLLECRKSR